MKNLTLTIATLLLTLTSLAQSQFEGTDVLVIKADDFKIISSDDMRFRKYRTIYVERAGTLIFENCEVLAKNIISEENGGIYLENATLLHVESTGIAEENNPNGVLSARYVKEGVDLSNYCNYATDFNITIERYGEVIFSGTYSELKGQKFPQGIYDIRSNGKLIDILYAI